MHEVSIVQALLERVEAEARGRSARAVHRLHVRIGELSGVDLDLFASAYEMLRETSPCGQAELEIESVPARWLCTSCRTSLARGQILRCPDCAAPGQLSQGDEIFLDRIEMEVA
jgi:hydrogenase nickel incorporation protein HypA/HybF